MTARRDGRVGGTELAEPLPVLDQLRLLATRQLLPVHVRAHALVEHAPIPGEPAARFIAVVDLNAPRQQHKAAGDPALQRHVLIVTEEQLGVVGADVAQHVEPGILVDTAGVAGIGGLGARQTLGLGQGEFTLVVEVDQGIEAVLVPEVLGDPVIPHLAHHVEGQVIEFPVRVGGLPLLEGGGAGLLELGPHLRLQMFDGIGAKTVDTKAAHPVGVPGDQVVAYRGVGQRFGPGILFRCEQGGQAHRFGGLGQEVREPGHRAGDVVSAGLRVARQAGAHPVGAPPLAPVGWLIVDKLVVAMPVEAAARAPLAPAAWQISGILDQIREPQIL